MNTQTHSIQKDKIQNAWWAAQSEQELVRNSGTQFYCCKWPPVHTTSCHFGSATPNSDNVRGPLMLPATSGSEGKPVAEAGNGGRWVEQEGEEFQGGWEVEWEMEQWISGIPECAPDPNSIPWPLPCSPQTCNRRKAALDLRRPSWAVGAWPGVLLPQRSLQTALLQDTAYAPLAQLHWWGGAEFSEAWAVIHLFLTLEKPPEAQIEGWRGNQCLIPRRCMPFIWEVKAGEAWTEHLPWQKKSHTNLCMLFILIA